MARTLKRVPLNFDYPIGMVWKGYLPDIQTFKDLFNDTMPFIGKIQEGESICTACDRINNNCSENAPYCVWHNPELKEQWFKEVPKGRGYQLWENTTEGSPISPVFETLDSLCEWCENNATVFAGQKNQQGKMEIPA